jgi:hypothetical protein
MCLSPGCRADARTADAELVMFVTIAEGTVYVPLSAPPGCAALIGTDSGNER